MFAICDNSKKLLPQEFNNKERCFAWCISKMLRLKHSIYCISKDKESLTLQFPLTNEVYTIYGDAEEIIWLNRELIINDAYNFGMR